LPEACTTLRHISKIAANSEMKLKVKALLAGLSTYLPGYDFMHPTGGTGSAKYCYSVWLRHLILGRVHGQPLILPQIAAELGPGDSIGIGLAALLSGVQKYYALDLVRYSDLRKSLGVFDELVSLFRSRAPVPADDEFPLLFPKLERYEFPHRLLDSARLDAALRPQRINEIKSSLERAESEDSMIMYQAPWSDPAVIRNHSIDLIYSHAVLEHVDDLPGVYEAMHRWLKPGGTMSHQIDFKCHGKADTWNGHWTYSDLGWKLVVGRRAYLLNRAPHSEHLRLLGESGFKILGDTVIRTPSVLRRGQLARRFRTLSDADLTTSGAFVLAVPR
jgi:SAM-dependent methyltransferase